MTREPDEIRKWERSRVCVAAEIASVRFGEWIPQRWLELFMDAYESAEPRGDGVYTVPDPKP
jgi:hypothetical protein